MSQILTQATTPLWKPGRNGNVEFLSSFKRLEKEAPEVFKQIEQREGFTCQDHEYEYKTGKSQYGLWCSRKRLESSPLNDKPPERPIGFTNNSNTTDPALVAIIAQQTNAIKAQTDAIRLQTLAILASTDNERIEIRKQVLAQ
jgi:hypothetical protein